MNYIIKGDGALVYEAGEMKELKTGDFTPVDSNEKHPYRNLSPDKPFKMSGIMNAFVKYTTEKGRIGVL